MNKKKIHPYLYIILSFVLIIAVGTILLLLPFSYTAEYRSTTYVGDYIANAFFMSSSAVCVEDYQ